MSTRSLTDALDAFAGLPVVVVGDIMLDTYVQGGVGRISPEAPVPIVEVRHRRSTLGGAANVASNLRALGMVPRLVGVVGKDGAGEDLCRLAQAFAIEPSRIVSSGSRQTTKKTRVMGGSQQMLRLDEEDRRPLDAQEEEQVLDLLGDAVSSGARAVVLSDYDKGMLTQRVCEFAVERSRAAGIPILVDPKGRSFLKYRQATAVTPNWPELNAILGTSSTGSVEGVVPRAEELRRDLELRYLIVTRGEHGISLFGDGAVYHSPAQAQQVFDVSGAGDTVIAVLAGCLALELSPRTSVDLANLAAGVVVSRVGTSPVDAAELRRKILGKLPSSSKVMTLATARAQVEAWKRLGRRVVFTNGCFDLLHVGHVDFLREARSLGDCLVVGLNTDASIRRLKGAGRPIVGEVHRAEVLAALENVDLVVLFDDDTPRELILHIRPDVLCKGADYAESNVVGAPEVRGWGGSVHLIPLVEGVSSTGLITRAALGRSDRK